MQFGLLRRFVWNPHRQWLSTRARDNDPAPAPQNDASKPTEEEPPWRARGVVVDVKMPFWSMVVFMIKWAVAAIPAMVILGRIMGLPMAVVGGLSGGLFGGVGRV